MNAWQAVLVMQQADVICRLDVTDDSRHLCHKRLLEEAAGTMHPRNVMA